MPDAARSGSTVVVWWKIRRAIRAVTESPALAALDRNAERRVGCREIADARQTCECLAATTVPGCKINETCAIMPDVCRGIKPTSGLPRLVDDVGPSYAIATRNSTSERE
jgi:hypothetical protein